MRLTIKEKTYSYTPDFQTNKDTWKVQAGAFFKFPVFIGGVNCFVKRFMNKPCGWDLVRALVGESHPHLPEIYAAATETEDQKTVFYLVTSFLEGDILSERLTQRQIQHVEQLPADLLKALAVIHQKGFWFADFCEKNVFWASQFLRFMLIDLDSCEPLHTRPHYAPNEPGYMPAQDFAAPTISFFKNILHAPNFDFHSLRGNCMNFCQLIFMSAKIGHFKNLLAQDPKTPFSAAKKIELPTHLLAQFAGNELFIKKVFEKIGQGLVNDAQILQICTSLMLSKENASRIKKEIIAQICTSLILSKDGEPLRLKKEVIELTQKNKYIQNQLEESIVVIKKQQAKLKAQQDNIDLKNEIILKLKEQIKICNEQIEIQIKRNKKFENEFQILNTKTQDIYKNPFLAHINADWWKVLDDTWKSLFRNHCKEKEGCTAFFDEIYNLQNLDCKNNKISNLEPLKNLTNLQKIDCSDNEISSLEPLKNLTNLQILHCWRNQISSLEPLRNLANLQELNCSLNQISSLEPIKNLVNLQELVCSENQISSLEPIKNLTNLQKIYCPRNQISNLKPLNNLTNLQKLDCWNNQISSLEIRVFQATHPKCDVEFKNKILWTFD